MTNSITDSMTTPMTNSGIDAPLGARSDRARPASLRPVVIGIAAAITGVAGCLTALPDISAASRKDAVAMTDAVLALGVGTFRVAAAALAIAAVLCALLASTLVNRLREEGEDGILAGLGMGVVVVGMAAGSAGAAQMGWVIHEGERGLVAAAWNVVDTVPFASFMGIGLAAGACAVAALRRGALPRWFGFVSAFVALLILGISVASLPFLAFAPGAIWLIALGVAVRN